jgi:multidrug efflux pump subunit AcrA (membrane-fusion protein)
MPGRAIAGKVALIEPTVRGDSRAARARVAISNTDGALRPGLFVRATIVIAAPPATTLIIPAAALQPLGGIDVVFVQRQRGSYAIRPVVVVRRTPQGVEIGEGLARGEPVVTEGAFLLRGEASKR